MSIKRKDSIETCNRLIEAACRVFGEKGFRNTRISDICALAGVNNALINYHFGNKKNLYREAWRYAHRISKSANPLNERLDAVSTPEERLRAHIYSFLHHLNEDGYDFAIMQHELSNPTGLLDEIMKKELTPLYLNLNGIICDLLSANATKQQIQFCHASIMGQCFHLLFTRKKQLQEPTEDDLFLITDIDAYIEHVFTFTLAGIKKIRAVNSD